jgi:signal transduction histidine kinase
VFDGLTLFVSHAVDRINSIPATSAYSLGRRLTEGLMGNRYGRRAQSLALTYSTSGAEKAPVSLGEELVDRCDDIVQVWYDRWHQSYQPRSDVSEALLKDRLPVQLRFIGKQLRDLSTAEDPRSMWRVSSRLDPEERVAQEFSVAEVVQEYQLAVDVIRDWIAKRRIEVTFNEYSYFFAAVFELAAESVQRYTEYQAHIVRQSRAEYLAGVMHQLRTPLATLSTQFALLTRTGRTPDAAFLARVNRAATRLQTLVDGILRVERYSTFAQPVHPQGLDAAPLVAAIMRDHEHLIPQTGFRYESRVDPALRISVDPDLFTDAMGNLVHNATKFTRAGFIIVEAEERGDRVLFRVRDSGTGIAPEQIGTLFTEVQPGGGVGTGLGLRIANHAVLSMGGTMGVESEPGNGSAFWFEIPIVVSARN